MKKVVLFAPFFVPRKRVGALRPYKFVSNLHRFSWASSVICFDTPGEKLTEIETENLHHTALFSLKLPIDRTRKKSGSDLSAGASPTGSKKAKGKFELTGFIDSFLPMDTWLPFFLFRYREILQRVKAENPAVLWTTADPWSGLFICEKVRDALQIPWVVDLRDPWSLDPNRYKKKRSFLKPIEKRIENRVFSKADAIVFTSSETLREYQNEYPGWASKMYLIRNGFQIDEKSNSANSATPFKDLENGKISLLFFGKFRDSSPAAAIVHTLTILREKYPESYRKLVLFHVGSLDQHDAEIVEKNGHQKCFVSMKPVPYEHSQQTLRQAHVLLSVLSPTRNQVIPTKFWDYLPAGKSVISIGTNPEVAEILTSTGLGKQFAAVDAENAAAFLNQLIEEAEQGKHITVDVKSYSSEAITAQLVDILEKVTKS